MNGMHVHGTCYSYIAVIWGSRQTNRRSQNVVRAIQFDDRVTITEKHTQVLGEKSRLCVTWSPLSSHTTIYSSLRPLKGKGGYTVLLLTNSWRGFTSFDSSNWKTDDESKVRHSYMDSDRLDVEHYRGGRGGEKDTCPLPAERNLFFFHYFLVRQGLSPTSPIFCLVWQKYQNIKQNAIHLLFFYATKKRIRETLSRNRLKYYSTIRSWAIMDTRRSHSDRNTNRMSAN